MDMGAMRAAIARGDILNTQHASHEAIAESLDLDDVWTSVAQPTSEVIEDYPADQRGPSCLVLSPVQDGPVHSLIAFPARRRATSLGVPAVAVMITIYRPDLRPHEWTGDYRTRVPRP